MRDECFGPLAATTNRRAFLAAAACVALAPAVTASRAAAAQASRKPPEFAFAKTPEALQLNFGQKPVARYQIQKPTTGGSPAESACYFHPVATPAGTVVTEVGPEDHPHHRGIFLGFVEVKGAAKGDFWGWGEPAPTAGRRIVNQSVEAPPPALGTARFRALNEWQIEGQTLIKEDLRAFVGFHDGSTMIELAIQLSAESEVTLARWAFGGFAVRLRKDGELTAFNADGPVTRPAPKHTDPTSNWPDAPWYGLRLKNPEGKQATVVVASRASNPATSWHVLPGIGLLNPCITAPAAVTITPAKPLVLRYRVLAFDGTPKPEVIQGLAETFYRAGEKS
ncbi:MAG: PmoA family protein [Verrucomicrobiales bacterium]|nr:PmoA family protein [Verrucomicrobiales bacterium]